MSSVSIPYSDLEVAYEWVCADGGGENAAYISKETGKMHFVSEFGDSDEYVPEDVDEPSLYWSVPHKRDLELGNQLVFDFIGEHLPDDYQTVRSYFQKRGAYSQLKSLLIQRGRLDQWHEYQNRRTEAALREWAREAGMAVTP